MAMGMISWCFHIHMKLSISRLCLMIRNYEYIKRQKSSLSSDTIIFCSNSSKLSFRHLCGTSSGLRYPGNPVAQLYARLCQCLGRILRSAALDCLARCLAPYLDFVAALQEKMALVPTGLRNVRMQLYRRDIFIILRDVSGIWLSAYPVSRRRDASASANAAAALPRSTGCQETAFPLPPAPVACRAERAWPHAVSLPSTFPTPPIPLLRNSIPGGLASYA